MRDRAATQPSPSPSPVPTADPRNQSGIQPAIRVESDPLVSGRREIVKLRDTQSRLSNLELVMEHLMEEVERLRRTLAEEDHRLEVREREVAQRVRAEMQGHIEALQSAHDEHVASMGRGYRQAVNRLRVSYEARLQQIKQD
ncbi:MAG: hypothetical protein R3B72_39590 [Polyangiaceae bacterium]